MKVWKQIRNRKTGQIPGRIQAIPQLTEVETKNLTRLITSKEILLVFFKISNGGKSSKSDGVTGQLYPKFKE